MNQLPALKATSVSTVCGVPVDSNCRRFRARMTALSNTLRGCASVMVTPLTVPSPAMLSRTFTVPEVMPSVMASRGKAGSSLCTILAASLAVLVSGAPLALVGAAVATTGAGCAEALAIPLDGG